MLNRITIGLTSLFLFLNMLQGLNVKVPQGSGVLIGENQILTANHLIGNRKQFIIGIDGRNVSGKLIKRNQIRDLALIEVKGKHQYVKKLRLNPKLGEKIYISCNPGRFEDVIFMGTIAKIERNRILVQSKIIPGMSGSGVFDKRGSLVGLVTRGHGSLAWGSWIMVIVPAWQIKEFLEE